MAVETTGDERAIAEAVARLHGGATVVELQGGIGCDVEQITHTLAGLKLGPGAAQTVAEALMTNTTCTILVMGGIHHVIQSK